MAVVLLLDSRFIMTEGHWVVCHIKVKPANASSLGLKAKQHTDSEAWCSVTSRQ